MLKHAEQMTGISVTATLPFQDSGAGRGTSVIDALEQKLEAGSALMVFLAKTLDHYTVISGMTDQRVYLFDSDGNHWIKRDSFEVGGDPHGARHQAPAESVIEVLLGE